MRIRVRFLASLSGLRIWCCHELWCRSQTPLGFYDAVAVAVAGTCNSDLTPAWELPYATGLALKSKKKRKKEIGKLTLKFTWKEKGTATAKAMFIMSKVESYHKAGVIKTVRN